MPKRAVRRDSLLAITVSIGVEVARMDLDESVEFVSDGLAHRSLLSSVLKLEQATAGIGQLSPNVTAARLPE